MSTFHLIDGVGGFLMLDKFPCLLEMFGCHSISGDLKGPAGIRPGYFLYLHHDAVEMKRFSCIQRNEDNTTVTYNLGGRPFPTQWPF